MGYSAEDPVEAPAAPFEGIGVAGVHATTWAAPLEVPVEAVAAPFEVPGVVAHLAPFEVPVEAQLAPFEVPVEAVAAHLEAH